MEKNLNLADIITNTLNKDYSASEAVADFEKLMNEATLIELTDGSDSPRFIELQKLIPVQERLMQAKLDASPIFEQLVYLVINNVTYRFSRLPRISYARCGRNCFI
jgi:hypothetical protein